MQIRRTPHRWKVTPKQAVQIQLRLAEQVDRSPHGRMIRLVAGTDLAFSPDGRSCIAAAVLWDADAHEVVEQHVVQRPVTFPYVPGLLSFREVPALLAVLRRLRQAPDALMCDGQGYAHPRRFGLACHVGVIVGLPTVGCAKSLLVGEHGDLGAKRGASAKLMHRGEEVGAAVRTRDGVKPIYASVGHRISIAEAKTLTLQCATGYRLPEPTRLADRLVAKVKRES
ncbi:MAG: deoxyribonuclease V [Phycisphaerales bacterium]|nr:deoxyribonuclease V [Phycisphaerales bacterium]